MEKLTFVTESGEVLFHPAELPENEGVTIKNLAENERYYELEQIAERLANVEQRLDGYEKLGLEPSQIAEIDRLYAEQCKEIEKYRKIEKRLDDMFGGVLPLEKYVDELETALKEPGKPNPVNARILTYEDSEKWDDFKQKLADGWMVELPCKVNDVLYGTRLGELKEYIVFAINIGMRDCRNSLIVLAHNERNATVDFELIDFGKTVFLSKEDAEQALKESEAIE